MIPLEYAPSCRCYSQLSSRAGHLVDLNLVRQPRVVQRVSIRGTAPVNYRGQSFSEKVKVQAAPPSLFDWAEGKLSQQQQQQ